jgi:uncharacterized protein
MTRDQVIATLREHEPELRVAGVTSLSMFGSAAREEAAPADVDISVRLTERFSKGGFDYFYQLERRFLD